MAKTNRSNKPTGFGHQKAESKAVFKSGLTDHDVRERNPLLREYFREDRESLIEYLKQKVEHLKQMGCEFPPGFDPNDLEQIEAIARRGSEILLG